MTYETAVWWEVAVWWPEDQSYGRRSRVESMAAALAEAARLEKLGYGRGCGEVHIIRTVKTVHRL